MQWRGPTTWRDMLRHVLSDTVNWQTRKWSNCTKFQVLAWMIINSSRRNSNQLENCQKYAHTFSWNVCIWHDLEDLAFCGRSTSLQDQSPNGIRRATDNMKDWFLTFITQTNSDNIVMWETRPSIVDWVYFKIQTLLATLRTRNQPQEVSCVVFLQEKVVIHYSIIILVHKFIPMPQAMKIPAAKAPVDKEWEKLEKIPAWDLTKVRSKQEVIDAARTKGAKVHFASLMDICHLKNAELEAKHQNYKGRVVLRGDIVKDDSGSYAVFTEQGSSASQMAAAKVMDIFSRLPGCAGQAADAVSAYTQVKMEDAHKLLKIPKSECPDIWIRLPRHRWPKSWSSMEDPVVLLERNLYGHPLAGLLWERQFEKILLKHAWEKIPNWECLFVHREKGLLFLLVNVDDIKLAGK